MSMIATLTDATVKRRGKTILGPINFELAPAGITIVLGPNGAGKTTLLKVLHGVERLSSGRIQWSVPDAEARQSQAYVFQSPIMLRRTVGQNLAYPLKLVKAPKADIARRVAAWADKTGLADAIDRPATRLSGGEKQKLALGRALIRKPAVLFLDEPCANLDGRSTREIEALLAKAHADGTRIIMTTHDLGQARRLAQDVIFLLKGQYHDHGQAAAFFSKPRTAEAKSFLQGDIVE
ncbi:ATP-binding cassette domain-containing protein [Yoonia sediminilitoris]|uniref:Phosphate ABC transporter ATP-binding protein (PhoT family) n=1 Tax=Yoonia sediminilitoris TaxID=1286148 RepID=A0A2T6K9Q1_9RHOB|nr:ATP-binding cassette domain-containing protein [Yoonia sediminilitoris]PUB11504.1 phosphate ABC transporter ATP-binding protein (PhoT family) [Yoonia sediminilitoris]RCW91704.1 phosphate ABC transporter ATP-binding protein (PhoT family) [Yoonia sediminilitoris]